MAVFSLSESDRNQLDYDLVLHRIAVYYSEGILAEDLRWLREARYTIHEFDCRSWKREKDFHDDVAKRLHFPNYYGQNLNAFGDSMGDVDVPDEGGLDLGLLIGGQTFTT